MNDIAAIGIETGTGCRVTAITTEGAVITESAAGSDRGTADIVSQLLARFDLAQRATGSLVIGVVSQIGSTTGLRVGIAAALGLGSALNAPVTVVSGLRLLADDSFTGEQWVVGGNERHLVGALMTAQMIGDSCRDAEIPDVIRSVGVDIADFATDLQTTRPTGLISLQKEIAGQSLTGFEKNSTDTQIRLVNTPLAELAAVFVRKRAGEGA